MLGCENSHHEILTEFELSRNQAEIFEEQIFEEQIFVHCLFNLFFGNMSIDTTIDFSQNYNEIAQIFKLKFTEIVLK